MRRGDRSLSVTPHSALHLLISCRDGQKIKRISAPNGCRTGSASNFFSECRKYSWNIESLIFNFSFGTHEKRDLVEIWTMHLLSLIQPRTAPYFKVSHSHSANFCAKFYWVSSFFWWRLKCKRPIPFPSARPCCFLAFVDALKIFFGGLSE